MMENRNINLSLGSNAIDLVFNNGADFLENFTDKIYGGKPNCNNVSLAGLDSSTWLMELNNTNMIDNQLEDTYSLDDILEGKSTLSPAPSSVTSDFLETPIGSPLSSSNESSYDLNELLFFACPEEVLSSKLESSSQPLAEHMYALTVPVVNDNVLDDMTKAEFSPVSDDSGFSSGDETMFDSQNILAQLLSGEFDLSSIALEEDDAQVDSTHTKSIVSESYVIDEDSEDVKVEENKDAKVPSICSSRYSPYTNKKKTKTPEQRQRKKAQNRNAASRYRVKKSIEMDTTFAEAEGLEAKNKELRGKVDGLKSEIDYLKNLMLDVIKARLSKGGGSLDNVLSDPLSILAC